MWILYTRVCLVSSLGNCVLIRGFICTVLLSLSLSLSFSLFLYFYFCRYPKFDILSAYHLLSSSSSSSSTHSCGMQRRNKGYPRALLPPSLSNAFQPQSSSSSSSSLSMPVSHVEKHAILFKLRLKLALRIKKQPPPRLFLLLHPNHTLHISAFGYILMECHGVYRVRLRPKDARNIMSGSLWVTDLDIHIPTSWKLPSLEHHHLLAIRDSLRWRLDASSSSSSKRGVDTSSNESVERGFMGNMCPGERIHSIQNVPRDE